jgi:hypothetical protein
VSTIAPDAGRATPPDETRVVRYPESATPRRKGRRRTAWTWPRRGLAILVACAAAWLCYDRRSELAGAGHLLGGVRAGWLTLAILLQIASVAAFAGLQRSLLLRGDVRIGPITLMGITLGANAVSTTLPGGAALSVPWTYGQLHRRGADEVLAAWALLTAGVAATGALTLIAAVGAWTAATSLAWLVSLPFAAFIVVGVAITLGRHSSSAVRLFTRAWDRIVARLPAAGSVTGSVAGRLREIEMGPPGWATAFGWALANWLLAAGCLCACVLALGLPVPWPDIMLIYGGSVLAALLPITPGGIGIVEGALTALLVVYGLTTRDALAVTLLDRIITFWAMLPIGWAAYAVTNLKRVGRAAE